MYKLATFVNSFQKTSHPTKERFKFPTPGTQTTAKCSGAGGGAGWDVKASKMIGA